MIMQTGNLPQAYYCKLYSYESHHPTVTARRGDRSLMRCPVLYYSALPGPVT